MPPCINATISIVENLQDNFFNEGGVEGRLEFFQKFIRFGGATFPLLLIPCPPFIPSLCLNPHEFTVQ